VRAASLFDAARWCASRRSASLLLREEFFWLGFSWLFLGVSKTRVRSSAARTDKRMSQKDTSQRTSGHFQRTGHGAATTHTKLSGAAHARRVAGAPIARAQRFGPARAVRFAGIVPLLRQEALPPGAHMLRRRPRGVRLEALVPQEGQAQDAAERMEPARAPQVVVAPPAAKPPPRLSRLAARSAISGWFDHHRIPDTDKTARRAIAARAIARRHHCIAAFKKGAFLKNSLDSPKRFASFADTTTTCPPTILP